MNIKSLLLGSAAAMVAVSSAQAADAVVVEPEPVEFVRVCDAYGSGFFFIPGTETCIRFSGFVRSAYEKFSIDGSSSGVAAGALPNVTIPEIAAIVPNGFDGVVVFNDDPSLQAQLPNDAGVLVDNPLFNENATASNQLTTINPNGGGANVPGTVFAVDQTAGFQVPDGSQVVPVVATSASVAPASFDQNFTLWGNRGRLNVDVRSETDWGTLRSVYRLEGGQNNIDVDIDLDVALISLAGFRAGFAGANYWSTNHGFGGINAESIATNASGLAYPDGFYGFDDATILDYTFAADGLAVTVGIEDPRISYGRDGFGNITNNGGSGNGTGFGTAAATSGGDGEVNFYAGFNYSGDFGTLAFTAAHDSLAQEVTAAGISTDTGGWAYKASLNIDLSELAPGAFIQGWYLYDGDYNTDYLHTALISENPETIYGIAAQVNLTDEFELWGNYWVAEGGFATVGAFAGDTFQEGDTEQFAVGLNWFPAAAPGFHVKATYFNGDTERSGSAVLGGLVGVPGGAIDADYDGFELSIRRDF